ERARETLLLSPSGTPFSRGSAGEQHTVASMRPIERRRAGPGADELRRQLREADRRYYETLVAIDRTIPPRPPAWRVPVTVAAALAAVLALIAASHLVPAHRSMPPQPPVAARGLHQSTSPKGAAGQAPPPAVQRAPVRGPSHE